MSDNPQKVKYDCLTEQERKVVWEMKQRKVPIISISKQISKNYKTIQSVKAPKRKSEYRPYVTAIENEAFQVIAVHDYFELELLTDYQQKKRIKELVTEEVQKTYKYNHLLPPKKVNSDKRRIIDKITFNVMTRLGESAKKINDQVWGQGSFQDNFPAQMQFQSQVEHLNNDTDLDIDLEDSHPNLAIEEHANQIQEDPGFFSDFEAHSQICFNSNESIQYQESSSLREDNADEYELPLYDDSYLGSFF